MTFGLPKFFGEERKERKSDKPVFKGIDDDTCRIYLPHRDKYLSFSLELGSSFLQSGQTRKEYIAKNGARLLLERPYDLYTGEKERYTSINGGPTKPKALSDVANLIKISQQDIRRAYKVAQKAFWEKYQSRRIN